jgi:nitric oxide reductase NorE protein
MSATAFRPVEGEAAFDHDVEAGGRLGARWIPGEIGIWVFILTDMCTFGFFFCAFAFERKNHLVVFTRGREAVSLGSGVLNTFLMLTASLCIALAVRQLRTTNVKAARVLLLGAAVCGAAFVIHKGFEWQALVHKGFKPTTDHYFQLFYMLTGIHLLHVVIAMVVLAYLWVFTSRLQRSRVSGGSLTPKQTRFVENSASYWHFVDLLWLVLFALLYLVK